MKSPEAVTVWERQEILKWYLDGGCSVLVGVGKGVQKQVTSSYGCPTVLRET